MEEGIKKVVYNIGVPLLFVKVLKNLESIEEEVVEDC